MATEDKLELGGSGRDGVIYLKSEDGKKRVILAGTAATASLGDNEVAGKLVLCFGGEQIIYLKAAPPQKPNFPSIKEPNCILGGKGAGCILSIRDGNGKEIIQIDGTSGDISLGGNGVAGDIFVRNKDGQNTMHLAGQTGDITLGGNGVDGDVIIQDRTGKQTIQIDGETGDIVLLNADCAEEFNVSETEEIEPGTVLVLDGQGTMISSTKAYDKRVAGVVSGAGNNKPGIVLGRQPTNANRVPVALIGTVHCKADAQYGAIEVGDLLTTSPTTGHAMKASDPSKSFGAVLGKALGSLQSGVGLVPIIVALQ
jgi:hypothetical protein